MSVLAVNEVIPRGYAHQFGGSPTASMSFIVTLSGAGTPQAQIRAAVGYQLGSTHPEFPFLKCDGIDISESDKFHAEVSLSFGVPQDSGGGEPGSVPWAAPDVWTFSTGSGQSACTTYYPNAGNVITAPLTNKANDAYEGLTKAEPELRVTITGYRQLFPAGDAVTLTGAVNDNVFAGGEPQTWQCAGISGTPERTTVGTQLVEYWQITSELIYRRSGHNLLLPNAGLNYLEGGVANKKRRCWVVAEDGDKVPSAGPLALADNGDLKQVGAGPYPPDILTFRIYPQENFSKYFGTPPATVSFN